MPPPLRAAVASIRRFRDGAPAPEQDQDLVAIEAPLAVWLGPIANPRLQSLGLVMRTPGHDRELVLGLLHAEGLVRTMADVISVTSTAADDGTEAVEVTLADSVELGKLEESRRALPSTSACGLCGRLALARLDARGHAVELSTMTLDASLLHTLPQRLRECQTVFAETGGLHAAGLFERDGTLIAVREDVGRHNAVDKLTGALVEAGRLPAHGAILVVSGRVAYEIVQKAAMAGVAAIVAVGAPSSLAIEAARTAGITLAGFAREGRFNVYAGASRLDGTPPKMA